MRPSRAGTLRRTFLGGLLAIALVTPCAGFAAEPAGTRVLDWETGAGKSYVIPAAEILAFIVALNQFNRHVIDSKEYGSDENTFRRNLSMTPVFDKDPFSVNQLGHPAQGGIYYGLARSTGLNYWQSLLYTVGGSYLWESYGEITPPSVNDHVTTIVGGSFVGEATFRMASLLLEGGGGTPGIWRELEPRCSRPPPASTGSSSATGSTRSFRAAIRPSSFACGSASPSLPSRANVGVTVRLFGPHAIGLQYVVSTRDARFEGARDRHQSLQTVSLGYSFLGRTDFGAVEWRPGAAGGR